MDLQLKGQYINEISVQLQIEHNVRQKAFIQLFIKCNTNSQQEFDEMRDFYNSAFDEEKEKLENVLFELYGYVDTSEKREM